MKQIDFENTDEFNNYLNTHKILLAYISAGHCNVCKALKPKINDLIRQKHPDLEMIYINTENNVNLCGQLLIFSIPTIIIYYQGTEYTKFSRNVSLNQLDEAIQRIKSLL